MTDDDRRASLTPHVNPVTRGLREGRVCLGALGISFITPAAAQIFANAGFSWYYLDMEHSQLSYEEVSEVSTAAKLAGIVPIAGPTSLADHLVARPLDAGAMGVVAPHVETVADTELVVRSARYPPLGARGLITLGSLTHFRAEEGAGWVEGQNREILVAVKVESRRGIENVDEIAAVPGLDAVLIGPGDLSTSLGIPGQTEHPEMIAAIEKMLAATKRNEIAGGPHVGTPEDALRWADKGATFMSFGLDTAMLLETSKRAVEQCNELVGDRVLKF